MGKPIVYCTLCGTNLREEDFNKGRAHSLDNQPYCTACKPLSAPPKPSPRRGTDRVPMASAKPARVSRPAGSTNLALFLGIGAAAVLLIVVVAALASGRRPEPRPSPPAPEEPRVAEAPAPPPPREEAPRRPREAAPRAAPDLPKERPAPPPERPPAPPPPAPPPVPAEKPPAPPEPRPVDPALARWEAAMAHAGARDYAAALQELKRAPGLEADADLVAKVAALVQEARETLSRMPKGQKVALEFTNEAGAPEKVEGTVVRTDPHRIEIQKDDRTVTVELGEIRAGALADLIRRKSALAAAILPLIEGEGGVPGDPAVPEKYVARARRPAAPDPREVEARRIFHSALKACAAPATAADAILAMKSLLADFGGTAFVRRNASSIEERTRGGREYFLFARDLAAAGTFRFGRHNRMDACWISDRDAEPAKAKENSIDVVFSVLPDSEYRLWVHVGGCCLETLAFFVQGTELSMKKGNETVACEPGSDAWAPAKLPSLSLKKLHSLHVGPKEPDRWVWVQVPLPRYSAPGTKTVRLLSGQKGFGVAYAFVSAQKSAPPGEAQLRELAKLRPAAAGPVPAADPDLVAWWRFEEPGAAASDSSGRRNDGELRMGAARADGKSGRAVSFNGAEAHVLVPDSPTLAGFTDRITVAAWVCPQSAQTGWRFVATRPMNPGTGEQFWLGFDQGKYAFGVEAAAGEKWAVGPQAPAGQWAHMAGTYDGARVRIYLNGEEAGSAECTGPVRILPRFLVLGARVNHETGAPGHAFSGLIDEVALYRRALAPAEVQALFKQGPGR